MTIEDFQSADEPLLRWFDYGHLPQKLQSTSEHFQYLAYMITLEIPKSAERTVALRKLLESKDAAVRAML